MNRRAWQAGCLTLLLAIGAFNVATIQRTPFFGDEGQWIAYAHGWFHLIHARFDHPYWLWTPLDQPLFVPYLYGAVAQVSGGEGTVNELYDFEKDLETNRREGRIPSDRLLWRCRLVSTILGTLGCGAAMLVAWRIAGPFAALSALLLLGLNPLLTRSIHRAMAEGALTLWILLGWLLCSLLMESLRRQRLRQAWTWAILLGITGGLGAMTKINAGIILVNTAACSLMTFLALKKQAAAESSADTADDDLSRRPRARLPLYAGGVALLVAYGVFVAHSPATWRDPIDCPRAMMTTRARLAAEQQQQHPDAALTDVRSRISKVAARVTGDFGTLAQLGPWAAKARPDAWIAFLGLVILVSAGLRRSERTASATTRPRRFPLPAPSEARIALVWIAGLTLPILLAIPLDWDRYYLPAVFAITIAEAVALGTLASWLARKRRR